MLNKRIEEAKELGLNISINIRRNLLTGNYSYGVSVYDADHPCGIEGSGFSNKDVEAALAAALDKFLTERGK